MNAVEHTIYVLESLQRLSAANTPATAEALFANRGTDGLPNSSDAILFLNQLYQNLTAGEEQVLWLGGILHDIGKATGNRECHPQRGLELYQHSPQIIREVLRISRGSLLPPEQIRLLLKAAVGEHDLIGGIGITRDRSIFSCAAGMAKHGELAEKLVDFLALLNFADIDGQGQQGIFNNEKLNSFVATVRLLKTLVRQGSPSATEEMAWGELRALAWLRGDTPGWSNEQLAALLAEKVPDQAAFYRTLGRLEQFDGGYNLATAIHDPPLALNLLSWLVGLVEKEGIRTITFDNVLIADLANFVQLLQRLRQGTPPEDLFALTIIKERGNTILRFSPFPPSIPV